MAEEFSSDGSDYAVAVTDRAVTEQVAAIIGMQRTYLLCFAGRIETFVGTAQERLDYLAAQGIDVTTDPWAAGHMDGRGRWSVVGSDQERVEWMKCQSRQILETSG